jgi:Fe-S-cluster containining protein
LARRKGDCLRCGRCCHTSLKCQHLDYDENGLSLCKVYDRKPHMCSLYPYNGNDYFYHLKPTCGYKYDDE